MRKWCGLFLSGVLALALAAPSVAEPKSFNATFALELGSFPPFQATATGTTDVTISGGVVTAFTLPASTFKLSKVTPVSPKVDIGSGIFLTGVKVVATSVKGAWNHDGAGNGDGVGSVKGTSTLQLTAGGSPLPAKIPLTNAIGITSTVKTKLLGQVPITLAAKKWTLGTATLITVPLGKTTSAKVTAKGDFAVNGTTNAFTYISPTQITIQNDTPPAQVASFGVLTVEILDVPEAGNVLLLATGAAVLLVLGLRRRAVA